LEYRKKTRGKKRELLTQKTKKLEDATVGLGDGRAVERWNRN